MKNLLLSLERALEKSALLLCHSLCTKTPKGAVQKLRGQDFDHI